MNHAQEGSLLLRQLPKHLKRIVPELWFLWKLVCQEDETETPSLQSSPFLVVHCWAPLCIDWVIICQCCFLIYKEAENAPFHYSSDFGAVPFLTLQVTNSKPFILFNTISLMSASCSCMGYLIQSLKTLSKMYYYCPLFR